MPPATVTTWPVTWPETTGEASATTWAATSSGWATLRSAIVREMRATCSAEAWPRVMGDSVHPGATALTRTPGDRRAYVERAGLREHLLDVVLARQVGADELHVPERLGTLASAVVVGDDRCALRRERPRAGAADADRRAGDEHALACEAGLHLW